VLSVRRPVAVVLLACLVVGAAVALPIGAGPDQHGAHVLRFSIHSRWVPGTLHEVEVVPPRTSGRGRPLLLFLHGRTADGEDSNLSSEMFRALAAEGARAPVIVFPDGGEASYWHDRADGRWATYVVHEVIPAAARLVGADPGRVAIGGVSMGGFGALDIARLNPGRFCAVGAHSAALWFHGRDSAPGAFDDAADFARHDLIGLARVANPYGRVEVWLDVGRDDPFRATDTSLARELRADGAEVRFHVWPGGHSGDYWRGHWGSYLAFYASRLRRCLRWH
jgi:S-formylglutathione hydrolase FrmB